MVRHEPWGRRSSGLTALSPQIFAHPLARCTDLSGSGSGTGVTRYPILT